MISIPEKTIQKEFVDKWAFGNDSIDVELQVAVLDKSDHFDPMKHMSIFKQLTEGHLQAVPCPADKGKALEIEADAYDLLIKQLEYDINVYDKWVQKCKCAHTARLHAKLEWKAELMSKYEKAANMLFQSTARLSSYDNGALEVCIRDVLNFRRELGQKGSNKEAADIPNMAIFNNTAPALMSEVNSRKAYGLMTWSINENLDSCGVVLDPVFSYHKGKRYLETQKMIDALMVGNHNVDECFVINLQQPSRCKG